MDANKRIASMTDGRYEIGDGIGVKWAHWRYPGASLNSRGVEHASGKFSRIARPGLFDALLLRNEVFFVCLKRL